MNRKQRFHGGESAAIVISVSYSTLETDLSVLIECNILKLKDLVAEREGFETSIRTDNRQLIEFYARSKMAKRSKSGSEGRYKYTRRWVS